MPDDVKATPGRAPSATPRSDAPFPGQEAARQGLLLAASSLSPDRLAAALEVVRQAAGRARAAHGGEVIDDLADLDLDDPMYLILDGQGANDDT